MAYVIGVDGGTESLRAHVFDLRGNSRGSGVSAYETRFPTPGRAEQNPDDWWRAIGQAVRGAVAEAGVLPSDVSALALDTTSSTVVILDENGNALGPAMLWMDVRATDEAAMVLATGDEALVVNGAGKGPVSAEWMIPKALWLKRHDRERYDLAATVCEYQDFIVRRLTGRVVASLNNVSMRWHYRSRQGGWPDSLLVRLNLADLREKWPTEIVAPGEAIDSLTDDAAEHLGLPKSVLVVQGGADAFIGMIGLGVARPGQLALITGSSHLQLAVTDAPLSIPGLWGTYTDAVYAGRHVIEGGQVSTGSIIAWLRNLFGEESSFARLNASAAKLPPGAEGLVMLDHFQGNRTPFTDPLSRGAVVGLSLGHGRAHLFRAAIEGICFGTKSIIDAMATAGISTGEVIVGGGATRSPLWLQIHADTMNLPVRVPRFTEAPALGSAILAAFGAGHFPDIESAIEAMVQIDRIVEPDAERSARYAEIHARYRNLYSALRAWRGCSSLRKPA